MKTLLINNYTKHLNELVKFLPGDVVVLEKEKLDDINSFDEYNLIVFSGGSNIPAVIDNKDSYKKEISMIQNLNLPILGICLGSEIINVAFGGTLKDLGKKIYGEYEVFVKNKSAQEILGKSIKSFEAHIFRVDFLPECFEVIADSENGIEVFKHKDKPIVGLQFHPEVDNNSLFKDYLFNTLLK